MDLSTSHDNNNKNTSIPVDEDNNHNSSSLFQKEALLSNQNNSPVTAMPLMSQTQVGHHQTPPLFEQQQLNLTPHLYSQTHQGGLSHITMVQDEQSPNAINIQLGQNTPTLIQTNSAVVHPGLVNISNQLSSPQLSDTSSNTGPILQLKSDDGETASPGLMISHDNIFGITPQPNQSISLPLSQTNEQQNQEQSNQDHLLQSQEHLHLNQQQENHEQLQQQHLQQQHLQQHHQQQQQQQQHMLHDMMKSSPSGIENHPMVPSHHSLDQQSTIHHQPFSIPNQMDEEHERVAAVAQQVMAQQMAHQYVMIQQQQQQQQHQQHQQQQHQQQQQQQHQQQPSPQSSEQMAIHDIPVQQMMIQSPNIVQQQDTRHIVLSQIVSVGSSSSSSSPSSLLQESNQPKHISLQNAIAMVQQQSQTSPLSLTSPSPSPSTQPQVTYLEKTNENIQTPPQNNMSNGNKRMNDVINGGDNMAHGISASNGNKKSRRHTFSSSTPPSQLELHIDPNHDSTNNNDSPHSALVQTNGQFKFNLGGIGAGEPSLLSRRVVNEEQKQALCTIELPPPPTPAELGLQETKQLRTAKDYEGMSRDELISRLVVLENERLVSMDNSENIVSSNTSTTAGTTTTSTAAAAAYQLSVDTRFESSTKSDDEDDSPNTPTDLNKSDMKSNNHGGGGNGCLDAQEEKSTAVMKDEDEDMEDLDENNIEHESKLQLVCKWKNCDQQFTKLQNLITHINDSHVGSGKPTYCCEWENCPRNQKPFTKRHKMYNHLRTHTGERPFVCTKPGCGKRFSRPDSLTTHIKTHSNVRPFICQAKGCGKAYYHSRSLKKHEKIHEITPMPPLSSTTTASSDASIHYKASYPVSVPALPLHHQHHHQNPMDYLNNQLQQQQQQISIHSQSLPNSPHPSLSQQQQQQQHNNFGMIQQVKSYTPNGTVHSMPSFTQPPSGMVENQISSTPHSEPVMSQLFDSANQTQQNEYVYRQPQ